MAIDVVPCSPVLGAEVRGLDLSRPLDAATVETLRRVWADHLVLVVKEQSLADEDLVRFSSLFGTCDKAPIGDGSREIEAPPEITVISNIKQDGRSLGSLGSGELVWHTDMSYNPEPADASALYAVEVVKGAGGDTSFLNMYKAYETLPPGLLDRVKGKVAIHDSSHTSAGTLRKNAKEIADVRETPGAQHPLLRTHPVTGRAALFLGRRRGAYVIGLSVDESEALLNELWAHTDQEQFVYTHRWSVGDVVMWDNRCVMHRRNAFDPNERRHMRRTQLKGSVPFHSG